MKKITLLIAVITLQYSLTAQTMSVSTQGQKFVLLEMSAATWDPWTPDGVHSLNDVKNNVQNIITVQAHMGSDVMEIPETKDLRLDLNYTAIPMAAVDRKKVNNVHVLQRHSWKTTATTQSALSPTFDIDLSYSYNSSTKQISANVTGTSLKAMTGDYRINLYVVEDSVSGGSQYDQNNASNAKAGHTFQGAGNPIVGYQHMDVIRDILGGTYGVVAFSNPANNTSVSKSFTYTVPSTYDIDQIKLVATVAKYDVTNKDYEVQNAISTKSNAGCGYPVPSVQICVVTTDTVSGKNVVVWEKTGIKKAKAYKIYRETSTPGSYQLLATQAANVFSTYTDATSSPSTNSYRYKLTVVDSCNREMALSNAKAHKTAHVSFNVMSNNTIYISWVPYVGKPYTTYTIKRSTNSGPYVTVAQVNSTVTSYSDPNPPSGVNSYRVEIQVPGGCSPTAKTTAYNTIISNATVAWHTGVAELSDDLIKVYPNPTKEEITISGVANASTVQVVDITGRVVLNDDITNSVVNVSTLNRGMYILNVYKEDGILIGRTRFQKL